VGLGIRIGVHSSSVPEHVGKQLYRRMRIGQRVDGNHAAGVSANA
jgi:hypothetical protein